MLLMLHQTLIMIQPLLCVKGFREFYNKGLHAAIGPSSTWIHSRVNGKDKATTIPWLDQVKPVAERTGNDLAEVGISELKGLSPGDINTIGKEERLTWHTFRQILIENYSNIPCISYTIVAYTNLSQQDDGSTSQYLIRAKVLLKHMNDTSKLS